MTQNALIAVSSDALRGLLQSAMPATVNVQLAAPSAEAAVAESVSLHLFRIASPPAARAVPVLGADGRRLHAAQLLHLDYLVDARAADPLQAQQLLGTALHALVRLPLIDLPGIGPLLSQPERLDTLLPASLGITFKALDLPLAEQAALWRSLGVSARGSLYWRAEVLWQSQ